MKKKFLALTLALTLCFALTAQAFALVSELDDTGETSFTFLYFGDIQVTESAAADFAAWEILAKSAVQRNPGVAFALQGGDIVESGISQTEWDAFFAAADAALGDLPFFPTNGNHESNFLSGKPELYLELFDLPQNGPDGFKEEFYSFDYGDTHVVVLNSWVFSGEQKLTEDDFAAIDDWVARDLQSSDATWKIAVTHVPLYPVHSDLTGEKAREHWAALFERYGVTLAFVGHQHVYSRLKPLTDGAVDYADGVTYIMGNSGRKFYSSADETYAERTVYSVSNYQLVTVDGDSLTVQTFDGDGNELDYVELSPRAGTPEFTDVTTANWYYDAVNYVMDKGLFDAKSANTFGAAEATTRATLAIALYRLEGSPEVTKFVDFKDVTKGTPLSAAVSWASDAGIVLGYTDGSFKPENSITREQIAAMLYRYATYKKQSVSAAGDLAAFTDDAKISDYARISLAWAVGKKYINGMGDGTVNPQGTATRAQVAQVLLNYAG